MVFVRRDDPSHERMPGPAGGHQQNLETSNVEKDPEQESFSLSVLKSIDNGTSSLGQARRRREYEERLLTYQATTYWAKPACLSPIICSRFGWCNADRDMLVCTACDAALAIVLHSNLSASATSRICTTYREQLATSHKQECPFRFDAEHFLLRRNGIDTSKQSEGNENPRDGWANVKLVVPTALASVFPVDSVKLMEQPRPISLLQDRVDELEQLLLQLKHAHAVQESEHTPQAPYEQGERQSSSAWSYSELEFSSELLEYQPMQTCDNDENWNMITEATRIIGKGSSTTVALALLGWVPQRPEEEKALENEVSEKNDATISFVCPICLAWMDIPFRKFVVPKASIIIESSSDEEKEEIEPSSSTPLRKRRRLHTRPPNPLSAHRHYCPWVCGFPTRYTIRQAMPVWKEVVTRLFEEDRQKMSLHSESAICTAVLPKTGDDNDMEGESTLQRVRQILRSGMAASTNHEN